MKQTIPNALYGVFTYFVLLLCSLFLAALVWERWVAGSLYVCTDPFIDILDIIPPFVHPGTDDVYLVAAWKVWVLWCSILAVAFVSPAVAVWCIWRKEEADA